MTTEALLEQRQNPCGNVRSAMATEVMGLVDSAAGHERINTSWKATASSAYSIARGPSPRWAHVKLALRLLKQTS